MHGCMHACMYVWSRVPCSRERELGGPYHWGGGQGSGVRTHICYTIYTIWPSPTVLMFQTTKSPRLSMDDGTSLLNMPSSLQLSAVKSWTVAVSVRCSMRFPPGLVGTVLFGRHPRARTAEGTPSFAEIACVSMRFWFRSPNLGLNFREYPHIWPKFQGISPYMAQNMA